MSAHARRAIVSALALALVAALCAVRARAAGEDPGCGVVMRVVGARDDHVRLPHGFIREGSDSLWTRRGPLRRGIDWVLDPLRGDVRLLADVPAGDTLWVATCWLQDPPPLAYSKQEFRPAAAGEAAPADSGLRAAPRPSTGRDIGTAPGGASFAVTGNKTIAVDFGSSQDAALRQSLDLAVSGAIAPGVELTGVLSDRNTPLGVSGSTQDLQSLDRVLIEVRGPTASASLGDIGLGVRLGEFARLDRQVQGMRGAWHGRNFDGQVAAASAQGEYTRMQFNGVDGLQGPYLLTGRDGGTGISVVAGSEVVTLDGVKLARGESADYSIDYELARITFTNRRPVSSASRITVEYQVALNRYRRNLAAFSGEWHAGRSRLWTAAIREGDDRGRPLDIVLDDAETAAIAAAGDSASRAIGTGLVAGGGDYDTVRTARDSLVAAFAGPGAGRFTAYFARVATGRGDYADSAIVAGRTVYRWVGPGAGAFVLGRALPLPESHALVSAGGATAWGPLTLEAEGATSRRDLNTASSRDDSDDVGAAARLAATLAGHVGAVPGTLGVQLGGRRVGRNFAAFTPLEKAFAEQDWGLPAGADLEHPRRGDATVFWTPATGRDLRATWSRLETPSGYAGTRRTAEWTAGGRVRSHLLWLDAAGRLAGVRADAAGRRRLLADAAWTGRYLVPSLRIEFDDRRTPGDSVGQRDRVQDVAGDLATGARFPWRLAAGVDGRLDRRDAGPASGTRATTLRASADSPAGRGIACGITGQHRIARDLATGVRSASDLSSAHLRGEHRRLGLNGQLAVELTSEADNRRTRKLVYRGAGQGSYDALGNFVGTGDYDMLLVVSPDLDRYARIATSARAAWQFGRSDAWRGSRLDATIEDEARRAGGPRAGDVFLAAATALGDPALARGNVTQRLEADLAPGSHVAALHLRAERRVTADRSYGNFAQATDRREGEARWRARPGGTLTLETDVRVTRQSAAQSILGGGRYDRVLVEQNGTSQLSWQVAKPVRVTGALEFDLLRPDGASAATRTLRAGPDVSATLGPRGRAEFSLRRAFVDGPAAVSLLPSADPAGYARWDGSARFDLRLHETTTFGVTATVRERPDRPATVTGRAEVRAFF